MIVKNQSAQGKLSQSNSNHSTINAQFQNQPQHIEHISNQNQYSQKINNPILDIEGKCSTNGSIRDYNSTLAQQKPPNKTYALINTSSSNINNSVNLGTSNPQSQTMNKNNNIQAINNNIVCTNNNEKENIMNKNTNQILQQQLNNQGNSKQNQKESLTTNSVSSTNALYQFLKNKHLSKDIQKRMSSEQSNNLSSNSNSLKGNQSGNRLYIENGQRIDDDKRVNKNTSQNRINSLKQQQNSSLKKNQQQHPSLAIRNYETTSSLSKGSSANNTPSKYNNYGSGNYQRQLSNSLKKVKSVSQFLKTSNFKEGSEQKNLTNVRSSSSTQQLVGLKPDSTKSPTQQFIKGISNTSSNINLLLNDSMTLKHNPVNQTFNNISFQNQHSKNQKSKSNTKVGQSSNNPNSSQLNNNALNQNWMNTFLEHYDSKIQQQIKGKQTSVSQNRQASTSNAAHNSTYQKFLYNSQQTNQNQLQKQNSKTGISISLNKSTNSITALANNTYSGKNAHIKNNSSVNQKRTSGVGASNSTPSTIIVNNPQSQNTYGNTSSSLNMNKSYQKLNKPTIYQDQKVGIQGNQVNHNQTNGHLNSSNHSKTMKKNLSFLSNSNHNGDFNITYSSQNYHQNQQNLLINNGSANNQSSNMYNGSSKLNSAHNNNNTTTASSTNLNKSQSQIPPPTSQQSNYLNNTQSSSQNRYSSLNYHKNSHVNNQINRKKSNAPQNGSNNHQQNTISQNLSISNHNINLNKSLQSQSKINIKPTSSVNQSVIIHNTNTYGDSKHNQSMVLHGNKRGLVCNDNQLSFQFDDLLRNLDRQVETQAHPIKKFQLDDEINLDIIPNEYEIQNGSPSGIKGKEQHNQSMNGGNYHQRSGSNTTQIKIVDNQSSNRFETVCQVLQSQSQYSLVEKESIISNVFNDIISQMKNQQDAQSLNVIKEYYQSQLNKFRKEDKNTDDYNKVIQQYENERQKRIQAEKRMTQMFEEMQAQQQCLINQEQYLSSLKQEYKKLQESEISNKSLIKQMQSLTDSRVNTSSAGCYSNTSSGLNHNTSQSNIKLSSNHKTNHYSQQQQIIPGRISHPNGLMNGKQASGQNIIVISQNQQSMHHKNKSAAPVIIPKLDLSKIKRDQFYENNNHEILEEDAINSVDKTHDFIEDQSDIEPSSTYGANDAEVVIIDDLRVHDFSDSEELILNDIKALKQSTFELQEQHENQVKETKMMKLMLSGMQNVSNVDDDMLSQEFDSYELDKSNQSVLLKKSQHSVYIPPLDFSKLKSNYQPSTKQSQQQQYSVNQSQSLKQSHLTYSNYQNNYKNQSQQLSNYDSHNQSQQKLMSSSNNISNYNKTQNHQMNQNKQQNLNTSMSGAGSKPTGLGFKLNLDAVKQMQKQEQVGFQDEFMAKIDEYSQSWREAALKEQRT